MKVVILGEHQGDGIRYSMHISAPAGGLAQMIRNPEGNWVGYAEYAALQAENERLTKERNHYRWASINDGIACNERARENQDLENQIDALKAENERLRKAGDDMDAYLKRLDGTTNGVLDCRRNWLAAKEVQS
jgi:FtsZ-binding cell division protein ZapB